MTPDDEGVAGSIVGYKIGKSMTPILGPLMLFGAAALLWNFWLGATVLKAISDFFPLLVMLAVLFGAWAGWTAICRLRMVVAPVGDSADADPPAPATWRKSLAKMPLKFTVGAAIIFGWLVQVGIDNPWPPKPKPMPTVSAKPASPSAPH